MVLLDFAFSSFFSGFGLYTPLFDQKKYPWEVLPNIEQFINTFRNDASTLGYKEVEENIFIGSGVFVDSTAKIQGPAIIGHNSSIGHAAFVRGGVLIGENVNIGHATEVKHSVINSNSALAHLNYVGDSIVGSNVNISGGATLANFRFDKREIVVKHEEKIIPTHLKKFGSIIGDNSQIGVNAVLNPGTILAKDTIVYPLTFVRGCHLTSTIIS